MFKYLIVAFVLFSLNAGAQSFYVASDNNIKYVTINGNSFTQQNVVACTGSSGIAAIAVNKNKFYRSFFNILTVGTISGNQVTNCKSYVTDYFSSLTVDKKGIVYGANLNILYKMDPANNYAPVVVGAMPYVSAGDLLFYKDELYMAASNGIVKIDINNPSQSTFVVASIGNVFGLAAVGYSSTTNIIYALSYNYSNNTTDVYQLDLDNKVFGSKIATLPFAAYDAASVVEDGLTLPEIKIASITQTADCPFNGNGNIQVLTDNARSGYQYTINNVTNTTGFFTNLIPGDYTLTIGVGFDQKDTVITIPDYKAIAPKVTYTIKNAVCDIKGSVKFSLSTSSALYKIVFNGISYSYDHNFDNLDNGTYDFNVILPNGCLFDTYKINIEKENCQVVDYPNAFTPNGDGINDVFDHTKISSADNLVLRIYNRYGAIVFTSDAGGKGWNGEHNSQSAPVGVYYWMATYTDYKGIAQTKKGYVTLIR